MLNDWYFSILTRLERVAPGLIVMNAFDENAFFLLVWRTILVALVGVVFVLTYPLELAVALLAPGNIALVFSLVLMACAAG